MGFGPGDNFRAYKALIAAQYSGVKIKVLSQPPDFKFGETNKQESFLKKFPLGKVPAFEDSKGVKLFESNAIAYYVANEQLRGSNATDASYVRMWMDFADHEILPASCTWVFPCMGIMQYNKQNTERAKEEVKKVLGVLNQQLETRTYLVGERISLADIAVCCTLLSLYQWVLEPEFRKPYQNTNRWFMTMVNQPQVKAVVGDVKLCDKMAQFDAKKFQELQGAGKGGKKEKQEKKKEAPKKEEAKPQAAAVEDDGDDEEDMPAKPSKDPFFELPKGTFVMDDWKKMYSNNDTPIAMEYFWEKFDKENYSVWYAEYKYPDELGMIFMCCNLVSGMFQRLDRMRKHSFGSVCVFGENNKASISGVWIWRGQDLAFELSPDLQVDYDSYSWTKLDYDNEDDRKKITEYFSWEGGFGGKKFNQGKIFK